MVAAPCGQRRQCASGIVTEGGVIADSGSQRGPALSGATEHQDITVGQIAYANAGSGLIQAWRFSLTCSTGWQRQNFVTDIAVGTAD